MNESGIPSGFDAYLRELARELIAAKGVSWSRSLLAALDEKPGLVHELADVLRAEVNRPCYGGGSSS